MKVMGMVLLVVQLCVTPLFAMEYQVHVVRQGGNLYWAAAEKMYIQTEYCVEDSATADAVLRMEGDSGDITFTGSGNKCTVKMLYGRTRLKAGKYAIRVSREDDNWYGIVAKKIALKTDGCLSLVEDMQAILQIHDDGAGTLSLPEADEECTVSEVYSQAQLHLNKQ